MTKMPTQERPAKQTRLSLRESWRRPAYVTSYAQELRLLNTRSKQLWMGVLVSLAVVVPLLVSDHVLRLLAIGFIASIGAIGMNVITGYAGQVSLGHAFFIAIGAYTAAAVSGSPGGRTIGFGITFLPVWLLAGGLVAALAGVIVAPLATRLRGLYLAVVTLGLVFIGEHVFREWTALTGGAGVGRRAAEPELFGYNLTQGSALLTGHQQMYLLMLVLLIAFATLARNIVRSRVGRAFAAVRDRDVAAATMGVNLARYKLVAFAISSFYAGCAGALMYTLTGFFDPSSFNLMMSVQYLAMIFIGGVATISGSIMGALFITLLSYMTRELAVFIPFLSTSPSAQFNVFHVESILYGLLIVLFLLFEPRGLFGIWTRIQGYWRSFPFTY